MPRTMHQNSLDNLKKGTLNSHLEANERKEAFLKALAKHWPNISVAAKEAGISRQSAFEWKVNDKNIAQAWNEIEQGKLDKLENNLFEVGLTKGQASLAVSMLRAYRRERYGEKVEHSGQLTNIHLVSAVRADQDVEFIPEQPQETPTIQ